MRGGLWTVAATALLAPVVLLPVGSLAAGEAKGRILETYSDQIKFEYRPPGRDIISLVVMRQARIYDKNGTEISYAKLREKWNASRGMEVRVTFEGSLGQLVPASEVRIVSD